MIVRSPKLTTGCRSSRSEPELVLRRIATTGRSSTFHERTSVTSNPPRSSRSSRPCAGVAADVVDGLVVVGPQLRVGRDRDEVGAGRLEHAAHLGHGRVVVLEVLEQVEGHDEVERVVREREPGRVTAQRGEPAAVRHLRAVGAVLEGDGVPAVLDAGRGCCHRPRRRCRGRARGPAPRWPWPGGDAARGTTSGRPRAQRACGPRCLPWSAIMPSAGWCLATEPPVSDRRVR